MRSAPVLHLDRGTDDEARVTAGSRRTRDGRPGGAVIASNGVVEALSQIAAEALDQASDPRGQAAFELWQAASPSDLEGDEAREVFASEAGFAAAARRLVETETGRSAGSFATALPHLYGSQLFSWFEPSDEAAARIAAEIRAHEDGRDPVELLGWLYQFSIPPSVRSRVGHFYTSPEIVRSMLDGVGWSGPKILERRLIDPACGAGAFLIEATRRVLAAAQDASLSPAETYEAARRSIHGLDLNPLGILLTEAALGLLLASVMPRNGAAVEPLRLFITDTLSTGELLGEAHAGEAAEIKARFGLYETGFDVLVANPPYAKYPSRLLTSQQAARFAATTHGHPNLYGLFLQVGVELLAEEGRLAFINPKSFVSGLYSKKLRLFLMRQLDLERFDSFAKRSGLFDGVLQEVVILTGTKRAARRETIELREYAGSPSEAPAKTVVAARSSVLLGPELDHLFFVSPDAAAHDALAAMLERGKPLRELGFRASTGTIVWNRVKQLIRDEEAPDALPLIWGNGIREYRFAGLGNRRGKATHCALAPKTQGIISAGDALLVKRMTAKEERRRLVACRVPPELAESDRGYFGENHVNLVRAVCKNTDVELDAILGLLNSGLFDFVFRALNGNTQVSATELEMLPIATGPELHEIARLARKLTDSEGADAKTRAEIDRLTCQLYGIRGGTTGERRGEPLRLEPLPAGLAASRTP